ncbi:MAG: hypothetical protein AB7F28_03825 [Candidatus Margulisiibacteriota bacterium]
MSSAPIVPIQLDEATRLVPVAALGQGMPLSMTALSALQNLTEMPIAQLMPSLSERLSGSMQLFLNESRVFWQRISADYPMAPEPLGGSLPSALADLCGVSVDGAAPADHQQVFRFFSQFQYLFEEATELLARSPSQVRDAQLEALKSKAEQVLQSVPAAWEGQLVRLESWLGQTESTLAGMMDACQTFLEILPAFQQHAQQVQSASRLFSILNPDTGPAASRWNRQAGRYNQARAERNSAAPSPDSPELSAFMQFQHVAETAAGNVRRQLFMSPSGPSAMTMTAAQSGVPFKRVSVSLFQSVQPLALCTPQGVVPFAPLVSFNLVFAGEDESGRVLRFGLSRTRLLLDNLQMEAPQKFNPESEEVVYDPFLEACPFGNPSLFSSDLDFLFMWMVYHTKNQIHMFDPELVAGGSIEGAAITPEVMQMIEADLNLITDIHQEQSVDTELVFSTDMVQEFMVRVKSALFYANAAKTSIKIVFDQWSSIQRVMNAGSHPTPTTLDAFERLYNESVMAFQLQDDPELVSVLAGAGAGSMAPQLMAMDKAMGHISDYFNTMWNILSVMSLPDFAQMVKNLWIKESGSGLLSKIQNSNLARSYASAQNQVMGLANTMGSLSGQLSSRILPGAQALSLPRMACSESVGRSLGAVLRAR